MRTWIIGAAAMLALAVPGVAAAQATGYVGASYSSTDTSGAGGSVDSYGVDGAVAFAGSSSISFEVDAAWATTDDNNNNDDATRIAGHVYARNDSHLVGGFVGVADSDATDTTWFAGVEGALYYDHLTVGGSIAYANNDNNNVDGWGVQADVRYFPMDNFRLGANVGWASIDYSGPGGNDDAWLAGVDGEYQFSSMPISIGLGYEHAELNDTNFDSDSWTVRLRYNWGGSLYDRDRHGASQADQVGFAGLL